MKPPITRQEYEAIELYLYGLTIFIGSDDWSILSAKQQMLLNHEIFYMQTALAILARIFEPTKSPRRSVVAWKKDEQMQGTIVHYFSSAQVAGKALDITPGDICRITNGRRISTGGYRFMYLKDFQELEKTVAKRRKFWWFQDED